jgi:hypothetical protein
MASPSATNKPLEFSDEQNRVLGGLAFTMRLVSGLLLLIGVLRIVSGVFLFTESFWGALLAVVEGLLGLLLGMVLLATAGNVQFMVDAKTYAKEHLRNFLVNLNVFYKIQLGLGLLIALALVIRLLV